MGETMKYCQACLANDRNLSSLSELESLLQDISFWQLSSHHGGVCWECRRIMLKFSKFKAQIQKAQQQLNGSLQVQDLTSLSKLTIITNSEQDYIFKFDSHTDQNNICLNDSTLDEETLNKVEIKVENDDYDTYQDSDYDVKLNEEFIDEETYEQKHATNEIYVGLLDTRKKRVKKHIKKEIEQDTGQDIRDKYTTIEFTEEEMMSNREKKRNQPNFKKIPYKCDSCVLGFTRKDTYEAHMEKKHDESNGPHICPVCQTHFTTEKLMDRHKSRHYVCYRCKLCKYETLELWYVVSHCRSKHTEDRVESIHCDYCDHVAKTPEELSQHMSSEHCLYCKECGEKFKALSSLKKHMKRIHAVKREFVCDICSKTFKTKSRLETHMVTHNEAIAQKLAYCSTCQVQYKNIYVYRSHLRTSANHAQQAYECMDCNKKFASKEYWKLHYKFFHLNKSKFRCELCNKLFISDWKLKNHRQTQHGLHRPRDHHCNVCGKQFYTMCTLKNHQLTHSMQRSFMCEDCGDTFKQRPALYTHCRLVHKGVKRRKAT